MNGHGKNKKFTIAFGLVVKKRRLKLKFSQEEFAEKASLHRTYISSIELGKVDIGFTVACKIADALTIKLSKLIAETELKL